MGDNKGVRAKESERARARGSVGAGLLAASDVGDWYERLANLLGNGNGSSREKAGDRFSSGRGYNFFLL